jgi:adenine-specific DNA-methyltransferase
LREDERVKKLTADDPATQSADIVAGNVEQLKKLFPEAFTEGKIEFDVLKQLLGGAVDEREEKYGLNWHGKRRARQLALTPSTGTLRPCPQDSVDWDTTQNLMIEGDNLEVLKLLQKSYAGKVKLIYIDPPYNTGKDFVYPDNFQDNIRNYLELTGQIEGGAKISSNTESSGRFHTDWLNMTYPRLKLARNLLRDDGLMFISIDERELANLKVLVIDIFGEENLVGVVANVNNPKGRSDDKYLATAHEYLVIVAKNKTLAVTYGFEPEENITRRYNKKDSGGRRYREIDLRKTGDEDLREDRPDMFYVFYFDQAAEVLRTSKLKDNKSGEIEIIPIREDGKDGRWRWGFDTASNSLSSLVARYMPNRKIWGIFEKDYLESRPPVKPTSAWTFKDVNSERGSEQLMDLGFAKEVFPRPKPLGTMQRILEIGVTPDMEALVLDFFAGSGSFIHSAMQLHATEIRQLKYIAVQLPEPLDPEDKNQKAAADLCDKLKRPRNIAELTKERLRRAAKKIKVENPIFAGDLGFRVFKLDSSNIRAWEPDRNDLDKTLLESIDHLKTSRTEADILYELLLKLGLDLCVPIEKRTIVGKVVHAIGGGVLLACLAEKITRDEVEPLALGIDAWHKALAPAGESTCVFRDSAFADDVAKTNLAAILQQHGLANVRSL